MHRELPPFWRPAANVDPLFRSSKLLSQGKYNRHTKIHNGKSGIMVWPRAENIRLQACPHPVHDTMQWTY